MEGADLDPIAQDMEALSSVTHRFAGSEGERVMLDAVRERLPADMPSKIEGFVAYTSPALSNALHTAALLASGVLGFWFPLVAAITCLLVTLDLVAEATGRFSLVRWLLGKSASYNLVARERVEQPLGAVVISAPLDAPRWRPRWPRWLRWRRPLQAELGAALLVMLLLLLRSPAQPWGLRTLEAYVAALVVLAVAIALGAVVHRRVGEGWTDASGPAVVLELMRRFRVRPPDGVEVWYAFTGCGRAFQGGMGAFLDLHGKTLPDAVLVLALDDPGRRPLGAVVSEGPLWAQHHRPTGPALVERLRWAGVLVPPVDHPGVTDARAAMIRGYRALAFVGGPTPQSPEVALQAAEMAETVVRWYAEDLARVAHVAPGLVDLVRATSRRIEEHSEEE